ncbi:sugar nucleotide-binding protein [Aurantivibrio infirmus]
MKLIVLGANSFVGSNLISGFSSEPEIEIVNVSRSQSKRPSTISFAVPDDVGVLQQSVVELIDRLNIDENTVVINCISMGDVDSCEMNQEQCTLLNLEFVKSLYSNIKNRHFKMLIHFSTNAVYDGRNPPYSEMSECTPLNFYGRTKLSADLFLLRANDKRVVVLRPITLFGRHVVGGRLNPVSFIVGKLVSDENLKLVDDVIVNILYVEDLVRCVKQVMRTGFRGLLNVSGDQSMSRYEIGITIADILGKPATLIESVSSEQFPTIAKRPKDTSFNNSLMKSIGVSVTPFELAVREIIL